MMNAPNRSVSASVMTTPFGSLRDAAPSAPGRDARVRAG